MTREENRKIIESLRPVFETLMQKSEEADVEIHISIRPERKYGSICIEEHEMIRNGNTIRLEYWPANDDLESEVEWREKYKKRSSATDQGKTELN